MLREECEQALEERKARARKAGEQAGAKIWQRKAGRRRDKNAVSNDAYAVDCYGGNNGAGFLEYVS